MAHDNHAADHGDTHHAIHETHASPKTALSASFWVVIILAGLFIAAVNFVGAMSGNHESAGHDAQQHRTEAPADKNASQHGEETPAESTGSRTQDAEHNTSEAEH